MPPARSQPARLQSVPLPYFRPEALQVLPLLSSQREMVYQQISHVIVVAEQEMSATKTQVPLGDGVKLPRAKSPHFTLTQSVPPSPAAFKGKSSLSSLESLELEKIPKPPGEVGRPGRGGYNLEEHLKWTDNEIRELKRVIHAAVKKYLDTTKSRSFQDLEAVRKVTDLAKRCFPQLEDYQNCWPVLDLIHLRLKYLSSRHRQKHRRESSECASA
ncbi:hypothetical protein EDC04DRAFT_2958902 [Pisolithus marmoratus]|nr:hypothetical protein EDC04DRAFT_2958902 [Pisolithus marmoratus]